MEGISQVSDEYQIHPLLSQTIISYFSYLINWSSWALKLVGFIMALFLLWSALKENVFKDLEGDVFDFPMSKKQNTR